jgi:hypothetical protein
MNCSNRASAGWLAQQSNPDTMVSRARKGVPMTPEPTRFRSAIIGACQRQFS